MIAKRQLNKVEIGVGMVILTVLVGIGIGIFCLQFRFNPAVVAMNQAPVAQTGKSLAKDALLVTPPEGLRPLMSPESFTPANLYEKINGQAELYLSAGFVALKSQRFAEADNPDAWLELLIYDMGSSPNALFMAHGRYYIQIIAFAPSKKLVIRGRGRSSVSSIILGPFRNYRNYESAG